MKVRRQTLAAFAAWAIFLVYFLSRARGALVLSLVLTPVLGLFAWTAIRSGHSVLAIFLGLALVSHALAPPFFFMRREFYTYGGDFGAVKDFKFGVGEFLRIYAWVIAFLGLTLALTLALRALMPLRRASRPAPVVRFAAGPRERRRSELALMIFVCAVAVPVNLFMYSQQIGITGIVPPVLPYRLTGMLYYSRMLLFPLVLLGLYAGTGRGLRPTALVVGYAVMAGFASSSRFTLSTAIGPVALFALFERRFLKAGAVVTAGALAFLLVSASRDYVYTDNLSYPALVLTTVRNFDPSQVSVFEMVGGIANRLWGPQDIVLAYQYRVGDRMTAIANYFNSRVVVENLTYEFYGMTFSESDGSAGFGVGLGYIPWMIVLADRSVPVLALLALVTGCLLHASEWVVSLFRRRAGIWSMAAYPAAFIFVYCLYTSSLNWWYYVMLLALGVIAAVHAVEGAKRRRWIGGAAAH